ncbi:Protein PLANT CADMIUM RESISTANCE 12 [Raphanus sativus]|uniref:Protein PLANT CADMIUM RESISTANCE 12-like n=1 Tax=Raphanus sativus TaxID=3726 RepID=A0A6J0L8C0_RAPSA|nr:protein PLANT CADMIUM RESISTANCE 12-like [Raphanus sativus]KAJ4874587.1 Protein PLANT CADMIUM RESISTANCE 12 [Raphanus sativus]
MYGDVPVFMSEGALFRDQPYAGELPQGLWTTGLCDCHEDCHICVQTAIVPCVSFARNTEIVNRGTTPCINAGLIHLALGFVGCCWLYAFPSRSRLREHFALPEEPCSDYWVHICCTPCAICQESRELKNQGADPSLGWVSNIEKWRRDKITPPIVVPGMNR